MSVYIANFGKGNRAWPECFARPAIAAMDDERVHRFWQVGDRDGYIQEAQMFVRLTSGQPATKMAASRWFNVNTILHETADDLWIHREKQELWWTRSTADEPEVKLIDDPHPHAGTKRIFVYYSAVSPGRREQKQARPCFGVPFTLAQENFCSQKERLTNSHQIMRHTRPHWSKGETLDRGTRGPNGRKSRLIQSVAA